MRDDVSTDGSLNHPPWRVWILDDRPLEARAATAALSGRCDIRWFGSGEAVLERLAAGERPEVLVTDYVLPGLSGLDVCRAVRRSRDRLNLPILVLTGRTEEETQLECLDAGANDFVAKPFRVPEFLARVETLCTVSRLAAGMRARGAERIAGLLREAEGASRKNQAEMQQKDRYLGILGHDLRNPLSAIIMSAELIEHRPEAAAARARRIQRSAQRMGVMIRDLLDFARRTLAAGIPVTKEPADLAAICADVADELGVANPGREIDVRASGDMSGVWDGDRLQQAISNLVGNALEHGSGVVQVEATGTHDRVTITVKNRGKEISPAELARLFEPFRKREQGQTGLGLGLFIVKAIAEAHGGSIAVESQVSAGDDLHPDASPVARRSNLLGAAIGHLPRTRRAPGPRLRGAGPVPRAVLDDRSQQRPLRQRLHEVSIEAGLFQAGRIAVISREARAPAPIPPNSAVRLQCVQGGHER